jgi:hypothetical protein
MPARTIADGAAVTNHFAASFAPWVVDGNFISVTGLGDETEIIDGPDGRGYSTGKKTKRELTVVLADHEDAIAGMHDWKEAVENGGLNNAVNGTVTRMDAGGNPIAIWELERCLCKMVEPNDMSLDGAEVGQSTFTITYYQAKLIGP